MKQIVLLAFLSLVSINIFAENFAWKSVNALDPTQPNGVTTYVGAMKQKDIDQIAKGEDLPRFVKIINLTIIEQTGSLKKVSDFPWGGGRFVMGNNVYVSVDNILSIQSINSEFSKELDLLYK